MKLKEFGPPGGDARPSRTPPLDPPLHTIHKEQLFQLPDNHSVGNKNESKVWGKGVLPIDVVFLVSIWLVTTQFVGALLMTHYYWLPPATSNDLEFKLPLWVFFTCLVFW